MADALWLPLCFSYKICTHLCFLSNPKPNSLFLRKPKTFFVISLSSCVLRLQALSFCLCESFASSSYQKDLSWCYQIPKTTFLWIINSYYNLLFSLQLVLESQSHKVWCLCWEWRLTMKLTKKKGHCNIEHKWYISSRSSKIVSITSILYNPILNLHAVNIFSSGPSLDGFTVIIYARTKENTDNFKLCASDWFFTYRAQIDLLNFLK